MTRIPLDPPRTPLYRLAEWYARRTYGVVPDPLPAMAHNMRVLTTDLRFEMSLARWKRLDPTLKALAVMASAVSIGCSWCVDFGYWETTNRGIDPADRYDVVTRRLNPWPAKASAHARSIPRPHPPVAPQRPVPPCPARP